MELVVRCNQTLIDGKLQPAALHIAEGVIQKVMDYSHPTPSAIDVGPILLPGLVDSHVHINEPGRTDWEGFDTATHAAAAGGITTLVDMPLNCIPVTTSALALQKKLDAVQNKLWVDCAYWGGATADNSHELPDLLRSGVVGAKSFTIHSGIDEFQSVDRQQLKNAMRLLALEGLPHLVHAELDTFAQTDDTPCGGSYQCFLASRPKHWENDAIAMVIQVMEELREEGLNPKAHIVHLSSAAALEMIARAKQKGLQLTAETCPHYLTLNAEEIPDSNPLFKCCPPIREKNNQQQLWQALHDGLIDCIVSDHSPCTPELKALEQGDLDQAWGGISALQFGLPLIWHHAQANGLPLERIVSLMSESPAQLAGLHHRKGKIAEGMDADFCIFDPKPEYTIETSMIRHKHKMTPYVGQIARGIVRQTWLRGEKIFADNQYLGQPTGTSLLRKSP